MAKADKKAAPTLKLPVVRLLALKDILPKLEGREVAAGTGDTARVVQKSYEYEGLTYLAIVKLSNKLNAVADTTEKTRLSIFKAIAGEDKTEITPAKNPAEFQRFAAEYGKVLETEEEIEFTPISLDALKLDINPIPIASVLTPLMAVGIVVE